MRAVNDDPALIVHDMVVPQAAHLAKADLATSTVMEMTALAGTMGRHYATKQVGAERWRTWHTPFGASVAKSLGGRVPGKPCVLTQL